MIWTYVPQYRSAGGHMDLRLCMFERRRGLEARKHDFDNDMGYVYACFGAGGHMDLRLYMFEGRRRFEGDMDLRVCMSQRLRSYGPTFMQVRTPAAIRTYASAYRSAGGHMDLRLCICERRGRAGERRCGCGLGFLCIWKARLPKAFRSNSGR